MEIPASTYRVQLSPAFTFNNLRTIIPYLERFQISTVYSAPFFQSREGSMHGYDIIDPLKINTSIGDLGDFREISKVLKEKKMSWLQDIVPNHMAFDPANPWIYSILELGPSSRFYRFFDINWTYKDWEGKVMAPFLGDSLEKVIRNGEMQLAFGDNGFTFQYFDHTYPASAKSYSFMLSLGEADTELNNWMGRFQNIPDEASLWESMKREWIQTAQHPPLKEKIARLIQTINASGNLLLEILDLQYFKPVHWKESQSKINFRRFFTINDLICLRMEAEEVFTTYHSFIKQLCMEGLISGLRIDHIDGLFDPEGYLNKLSAMLGNDFFIIMEKILEWGETLPPDWPVQGTSGYHFLALVNNLFTASRNEEQFKKGYEQWYPGGTDYKQLVYDKKCFILKERMGGELQNLWDLSVELKLWPESLGIDEQKGKAALTAFLAGFPVYRIYPKTFPLTDRQQQVIEAAHQTALNQEPELKKELDSLKSILTGEADKNSGELIFFLQRCQQFTGPLAAKGVEDTSFYIFNRLISQNEVGDSPHVFGLSIEGFHGLMKKREARFPLSINATATHDTKRGEDARMRINVLSEIPEEWFAMVEEWHRINQRSRKEENIPDKNEEYFIYQALLGAMPFGQEEDDFLPRTRDYLQKVLREAKEHSFWSEPNETYEEEVFGFVEEILKNEEFRRSFDPFRKKIAFFGVLNALGQSLIKVTAPGIPDIYQGSELWDLSYVDPDNRRPVNYAVRNQYLNELEAFHERVEPEQLRHLMENYADGKIKMFTLYRALKERRFHQSVFDQGAYTSLSVSEDFSTKILGYARHNSVGWYLVVVPLMVTTFCTPESFPVGPSVWKGGLLHLPEGAPEAWTNVFTGDFITSEGTLELGAIFSAFPVALLKSRDLK